MNVWNQNQWKTEYISCSKSSYDIIDIITQWDEMKWNLTWTVFHSHTIVVIYSRYQYPFNLSFLLFSSPEHQQVGVAHHCHCHWQFSLQSSKSKSKPTSSHAVEWNNAVQYNFLRISRLRVLYIVSHHINISCHVIFYCLFLFVVFICCVLLLTCLLACLHDSNIGLYLYVSVFQFTPPHLRKLLSCRYPDPRRLFPSLTDTVIIMKAYTALLALAFAAIGSSRFVPTDSQTTVEEPKYKVPGDNPLYVWISHLSIDSH
jgi:hypothetical protein